MLTLTWFGHASFRLADGGAIVYIDPWKIRAAPRDGTLVLVSHAHFDHFSPEDIARVAGPGSLLIAPPDVAAQAGGRALKAGETAEAVGVKVYGLPAYNIGKRYHPLASGWLGFVIELCGKRVYYAGDTDLIPEMGGLKNIDLAILPVGGTYTMTAEEAAKAVDVIKPAHAVPSHWGDIVGLRANADAFAALAGKSAAVLTPGQHLEI